MNKDIYAAMIVQRIIILAVTPVMIEMMTEKYTHEDRIEVIINALTKAKVTLMKAQMEYEEMENDN